MNTSVMMRCPKCNQASELCNLHLLDKSFKLTWVGLTNEEVDQMASNAVDAWECARAVEEKLRAKNSTLACIPAVPPG
jgi:Na+-translocating ferredoxin:NAD+ oxidoreductase RnfC subunit